MSLRKNLTDKVFVGERSPLDHKINPTTTTAAPSAGSYPNALVGELIYDETGTDWYITTVAGTTWVKINA